MMSSPVELIGTIQTALEDAKSRLNPFLNKLHDLDEEISKLSRHYDREKKQREELTGKLGRCEYFLVDRYSSCHPRLEDVKREHRRILEARSRCEASILKTLDGIGKARDERRRHDKLLRDAEKALRSLCQEMRGGDAGRGGGGRCGSAACGNAAGQAGARGRGLSGRRW